MNDVIELIKTINGEEIIATITSEDMSTLVLKDTVTVAYHPTGDGKMSAGFAPHMPYSDGQIRMSKTAVAFRAEVKQDMLNEYKRIFGGIITPSSSIIM